MQIPGRMEAMADGAQIQRSIVNEMKMQKSDGDLMVRRPDLRPAVMMPA